MSNPTQVTDAAITLCVHQDPEGDGLQFAFQRSEAMSSRQLDQLLRQARAWIDAAIRANLAHSGTQTKE